MDQEYLIALGSNLAAGEISPLEICTAAVSELARAGHVVRRLSRFYQTPAFPAGSGPDYVNAACAIGSALPPEAVLRRLHAIEAQFARTRPQRWGARTLDLDLLTLRQEIRPDRAVLARWMTLPPEDQPNRTPEHLILPHPRLQDRGFVLVPLADIAPGWRHPVSGLTVAEMLAALDPAQVAEVTPL